MTLNKIIHRVEKAEKLNAILDEMVNKVEEEEDLINVILDEMENKAVLNSEQIVPFRLSRIVLPSNWFPKDCAVEEYMNGDY